MMCDSKLRVVMCSSKLRSAGANPLCGNLRCACVRCIFRLAMCDYNFAPFSAIMKDMKIGMPLILGCGVAELRVRQLKIGSKSCFDV